MNSFIYLDIGNSNTKWKYKDEYFEVATSEFSFDKLPKSSKIWTSNVSSNFVIKRKSYISIVESQKKYKSLVNSYKEHKYLGSDRWLAMMASYELSLGEGFIVVDIGTAITIDYVDNFGIHLGGLIFPGLERIRKSFSAFPIYSQEKIYGVGKSTEEAWTIGTLCLIVNTLNQKISELKNKLPNLSIYLTGGGYLEIKNFLEFDHYYHEYLVLDGLEFFADNMG